MDRGGGGMDTEGGRESAVARPVLMPADNVPIVS